MREAVPSGSANSTYVKVASCRSEFALSTQVNMCFVNTYHRCHVFTAGRGAAGPAVCSGWLKAAGLCDLNSFCSTERDVEKSRLSGSLTPCGLTLCQLSVCLSAPVSVTTVLLTTKQTVAGVSGNLPDIKQKLSRNKQVDP